MLIPWVEIKPRRTKAWTQNQPLGHTYTQSSYKVVTKWEAVWSYVGRNWESQDATKLGQVGAKLINFGTNLEPSWALLGQVGPCWGHVGTRLGQVGAKMGQGGLSWVQFRTKLRQVGTMLSEIGTAKIGPSWAKLGLS